MGDRSGRHGRKGIHCRWIRFCVKDPPFFWAIPERKHKYYKEVFHDLGAVHILRQPKTGVRRPPPLCQKMSAFGWPPLPPLSAFVSNWLTPPPPFVSFRQLLGSAPFVQQTLPKTFWNDNMGDIHLLGSNLHVIWLCPMFKAKLTLSKFSGFRILNPQDLKSCW